MTTQVRHGLGIDAATAGLFTSIPVLLFAVVAPGALLLITRAGLDRALLYALIGITAGTVIRSVGGLPVALLGTVVLGAAIAVGNVAVPVTVGRDFPTRAGPMTGLYTVALNGGAMTTSLLTAPLADVVGWRWALALWAVLGLVASLAWTAAARLRRDRSDGVDAAPAGTAPAQPAQPAQPSPPADPKPTPAWRRPAALLLALTFACQSFGYYGVTAWLPSLLADERGLSRAQAGVSSSLFQVMGMVGAIVVPLVIRRGLGHRAVMLGVCASWVVLPLGLVVAPALWWLWCLFGGLAQGGGFTAVFTIVLRQARSTVDRQRLSTLVQGLGYAIGAFGPTVVGAVHQAAGSWNAPMLIVAGVLVVMAVAGGTAATLSPPLSMPTSAPAPTSAPSP